MLRAAGVREAFVVPEWKVIAVEVFETEPVQAMVSPPVIHFVHEDGRKFIAVAVELCCFYDLDCFLAGKYSHCSPAAMKRVRDLSGLPTIDEDADHVFDDISLQVLDRYPELLSCWRDFLYDSNEYSPLDTVKDLELLPLPPASVRLQPGRLRITKGSLDELFPNAVARKGPRLTRKELAQLRESEMYSPGVMASDPALFNLHTLPEHEFLRQVRKLDYCRCYLQPLFDMIGWHHHALVRGKIFLVQELQLLVIKPEDYQVAMCICGQRWIPLYHVRRGMVLAAPIGSQWSRDIEHFVAGRYSQFSPEAKEKILHDVAEWPQRKAMGRHLADFRIEAMNRSLLLRAYWNKILFEEDEESPLLLDGNLELLPPPRSSCFMPVTDLKIGSFEIDRMERVRR